MPAPRNQLGRGEGTTNDTSNRDPLEILVGTDDPLGTLLALIGRARPAWTDRAACRGTSVDFTSPAPTAIAQAIQVCGRCEVREACRDWADEIGDTAAVLGGEDPSARRARWRLRGINQKGTSNATT